jgi:hypothetical protein
VKVLSLAHSPLTESGHWHCPWNLAVPITTHQLIHHNQAFATKTMFKTSSHQVHPTVHKGRLVKALIGYSKKGTEDGMREREKESRSRTNKEQQAVLIK